MSARNKTDSDRTLPIEPTTPPKHNSRARPTINTDFTPVSATSTATSQSKPRRRIISSTEIVYSTPETAQQAFATERHSRPLPRPATPHTSAHRPSFASSRSKSKSNLSLRSVRTDESGRDTVGPFEPHFGSARGIGPAGEAIEVIGLGRKEPRHRKYPSELLKPALRGGLSRTARNAAAGRDKPLPPSPMSFIAPVFDSLSRRFGSRPGPAPSGHSQSYQPARSHARSQSNGHGRSHSYSSNTGSGLGLRSLFSSLTMNPNVSNSIFSTDRPRSRYREREALEPADDLFEYLRNADVGVWVGAGGSEERGSGLGGWWGLGKGRKGLNDMSWEWGKRWRDAEAGRARGRALRVWESAGRGWEAKILEWCEDNVPSHGIDPNNRWGGQIFALPAEGYETVEYHDDDANESEDQGALSWLTGAVLQTAVSSLQMLRYSSHPFAFHYIPSPITQQNQHESAYNTSSYHQSHTALSSHSLTEGFGTLVLTNKNDPLDRSMILEVRPVNTVDGGVMKKFARGGRIEGWWHVPAECCVGDVGQANLLQSQVYDACVQNGVYFFAVTNLKYWVFGHFSGNYSKCTVGPVLDRRQRDPSLMQCLAAWVIRSVDERPRALNQQASLANLPPPQSSTGTCSDIRHRANHNRSRSYTQDDFTYPSHTPQSHAQQYTYPLTAQQQTGYASTPPYSPNAPSLTSQSPYTRGMDFGPPAPGYYDPHGPAVGNFGRVSGYTGMGGGNGMYNTWTPGMAMGVQGMAGQGTMPSGQSWFGTNGGNHWRGRGAGGSRG